jgi:hypothetical protein
MVDNKNNIIFDKELKIFYIKEIDLNSNMEFPILGGNKNTEYIVIYKCNFNEDKTKIISTLFAENFPNVVTADLSHNNLGSDIVKDIITLISISKKLTSIDLSYNNFSSDDIECLRKNEIQYPNLKLYF